MQPGMRLFLLLDQARLQMHRPVGEIFDYENGFIGLKMLAEIIVRLIPQGMASLLLPPDGVHNILTLPSGNYKYGFQLDNKLEKINDDKHYLLALQYENKLHLQNYIIIKVDEEGSGIYMYLVSRDMKIAQYVTYFDENTHDNKIAMLSAIFRVTLAELNELNDGKVERLTVY